MQHLHGDTFDQLFRDFTERAFHLETRDSYTVPEEAEPLRKFIAGEPDDYAWCEPWDTLMREVTVDGRLVQRVRIVTVPHAEYTKFLVATTPDNISAGEDVRWLPRHLAESGDTAADDFWLFDDNLVAFSVFEPDGSWNGAAVTTDPVIAGHCRTIADRVWRSAIPHRHYVDSEYAQL